jgi:hypothetical protein
MPQLDPRKRAAIGPSDSSDRASDLIGADDWRSEDTPPGAGPRQLDAETDAEGTGERATAGSDEEVAPGADIAPDRIIMLELPSVPDGLDRTESGADPSSSDSDVAASSQRDRNQESTSESKSKP